MTPDLYSGGHARFTVFMAMPRYFRMAWHGMAGMATVMAVELGRSGFSRAVKDGGGWAGERVGRILYMLCVMCYMECEAWSILPSPNVNPVERAEKLLLLLLLLLLFLPCYISYPTIHKFCSFLLPLPCSWYST